MTNNLKDSLIEKLEAKKYRDFPNNSGVDTKSFDMGLEYAISLIRAHTAGPDIKKVRAMIAIAWGDRGKHPFLSMHNIEYNAQITAEAAIAAMSLGDVSKPDSSARDVKVVASPAQTSEVSVVDDTPHQDIHDAVVHGLRHYFSDHGDMTPANIGSATKRIMGKVKVGLQSTKPKPVSVSLEDVALKAFETFTNMDSVEKCRIYANAVLSAAKEQGANFDVTD